MWATIWTEPEGQQLLQWVFELWVLLRWVFAALVWWLGWVVGGICMRGMRRLH